MKRYLATATLGILAALVGFAVVTAQPGQAADEAGRVVSIFQVQGMTCGGCEAGVRLAVRKLDGVERVEVSYEKGRAEVTYEPAKVTPEKIIAAIAELGYTATLIETNSQEGASRGANSTLARFVHGLRCC